MKNELRGSSFRKKNVMSVRRSEDARNYTEYRRYRVVFLIGI